MVELYKGYVDDGSRPTDAKATIIQMMSKSSSWRCGFIECFSNASRNCEAYHHSMSQLMLAQITSVTDQSPATAHLSQFRIITFNN